MSDTVAAARPARRRRGWRRWLVRSVVALGVLLVVVRFAGVALLPTILDRVGAKLGLAIRYEGLELSLFGGSLELWHLDVTRRTTTAASAETPATPEAGALVHLEYLAVDVDMSALLTGTLRMHRVDVAGLEAKVARTSGGAFGLDGWTPPPAEPEAAEPPEPIDLDLPFDLTLPVTVASLRLKDVRIRLRDEAVEPPFATELALDVRISDVGSSDRATQIEVLLRAPGVVEALELRATGSTSAETATLASQVRLRGLVPEAVARFARDAGLRGGARRVDLDLEARLRVATVGTGRRTLTAEFELPRCELLADGQTELAATAKVVVAAFDRRHAEVELAEFRVDGRAARLADQSLRAFGFELAAPPASGDPAAGPADPPQEPAVPEPVPPAPPFLTHVHRIVPELHFRFRDEAVTPPNDLVLDLENGDVKHLVSDPAQAEQPIELDLKLAVADVNLSLVGTLVASAARQSFAGALDVAMPHGLARVATYLRAAGVEPTLAAAALHGKVNATVERGADGEVEIAAGLTDWRLTDRDGQDELFALDRLVMPKLSIDRNGGRTRLPRFELGGLRLRLHQDETRALCVAGVRTLAPVGNPSAAPFDLAVTNLSIEVDDLQFGGAPDPAGGSRAPAPARLKLAVAVRDLVDELALTGTLQLQPRPLDVAVDLALSTRNLRTTAIDPLLAQLGITSELTDGALALRLQAAARQEGETLRASAALDGFEFTNAGVPLVSIDAVRVPEVLVGSEGIRIPSLDIVKPQASARRDRDGALVVGGLVFRAATASGSEPPPPVAAVAAPASKPPRLELGSLRIDGAGVTWQDDRVEPAVSTALQADVTLTQWSHGIPGVPGAPAPPAQFDVRVQVAGALEDLRVAGTLRSDLLDLGVNADIAVQGLQPAPLRGYLPPELEPELTDGRLRLHLEAALVRRDDGSSAARIELRDLDFRDGEQGEPCLALARFTGDVPRFDRDGGPLEIAEIASEGLTLRVRQLDARTVAALGFRWTPPAGTPPAAVAAAVEPTASAAAPAAAADVALAGPRWKLPAAIEWKKLDLGIARLDLEDLTHPERAPVHATLRVTMPQPYRLASEQSENEEELEPLVLRITAAAEPLLRAATIDLQVTPFAAAPTLGVTLLVEGFRGAAWTELLPALAEGIDAGAITDGRFEAKLSATLDVRRRTRADFDLRQGFGLDVEMKDVAWRATPDGEILAGVEAVTVEVASIRPATGDVHVRSIDVRKPIARIVAHAGGLEVAGIRIAQRQSEPPPVAAAPRPGIRPEIRIDDLVIQGIDVSYTDATVAPPTLLPISDLDLEVTRFTTRTLTEPRPFQFDVRLAGGPIELDVRDDRSLLGGSLSAAVGAIKSVARLGERKQVPRERRPAWDEIAVAGQLALFPTLHGWTRLNVRALELQAFKSAAAQAGVEIGDGTVDVDAEFLLREGGLTLDSTTTFTWLSLSEPANGPISTYLKLPASLDAVLFLLRDENGQQALPVHLTVARERMSGSEITRRATEAVVRLIGSAVASAPLRVASGALDELHLKSIPGLSSLPGLDRIPGLSKLLGSEPAFEFYDEPIVLDCAPGVAVLPADAGARLERLFGQMRDDPAVSVTVEHQLGGGDVTQARLLAQPDRQDCLEIGQHLRHRRNLLIGRRNETAADVVSAYLMGQPQEATASEQALRALDRELAVVEEALDGVLELSSATGRRNADRLARTACLTLADLRLLAVEELLRGGVGAAMGTRVELKRPRLAASDDPAGGRIILTPRRVGGTR